MQFTLMEDLWFGEVKSDPAEEAAANSLVAHVAELHGLRPFPVSAQKLITLVRGANYTVGAVERIIESDPLLAARVMRVVNSAAYALRTRCKSVSHAVVLLGARALSDIATAMAVLDMFDGGREVADKLRSHSVAVGTVSRQLALQHSLPPDEVFTCGLLHDLGKLLILQAEEDVGEGEQMAYEALLQCNGHAESTHLWERETYGYDHAVLAGHILRAWQIPNPVPVVVAKHHMPGQAFKLSENVSTMVSLVRLADRLTYALDEGSRSDDELVEELGRSGDAAAINLDEKQLAAMMHNLVTAHLESRSILAA
jgi:putative nucleotidyltransferase with HDIG domain